MPMYEKEKADHEIDTQAEDSFASVFRKLPEIPSGTVRLFDRGDFYTAHGSSAVFLATSYFKTQTVLKYYGRAPAIPSCTLSPAAGISFLREALTTFQLRVEIYSSPGAGKWELSKAASPGNLGPVEDMLFDHHRGGQGVLENPVILALKLGSSADAGGGQTIGVAFADTSSRTMGVCEFKDNDLFSNTEALLIQLGAKEVLLPSSSSEGGAGAYELNKLKDLVERCGAVLTERPKKDWGTSSVEQDLNRLLLLTKSADGEEGGSGAEQKISTLPEWDHKNAMASVAAVIKYLDLMDDERNFGRFRLGTHDLGRYMRLDASALRALHLMPESGSGGAGGRSANKNTSLFGLLNRCKTAQGTRLLAMWLKQPLVNLHELKKRQDLVQVFFDDFNLRTNVANDELKLQPDLHRLSKRFQRFRASSSESSKSGATLDDVVRVYQAVTRLPHLLTLLEGPDSELLEETFIKPLRSKEEDLAGFEELVESTIDLTQLAQHQVVIKADYDDELQEIKAKMDQATKGLDKEYRRVAGELGMSTDGKTLHFEQHVTYGHCLRLTRKEAGAIKKGGGYIELGSKSNGTYFTTKKLKGLNEDHKDLSKSYQKAQNELVKEVIKIAATYSPLLEELNDLVATLDVLVSLATAARNAPIEYVRPVVHEFGEGNFVAKEARHPCLEVMDDCDFIPNDISMIRGESEFQIITGPNMGGKSTYIRQAGIIALMAQIGSFVPCASAELPIFDSILCRVGAGDSQVKGVSTFMAEMLETSSILKTATKGSLIVIDELGRGTSTYDGFGLAWSISEHLATETRAFCFFASHFHELTALEKEIPHVKNLHVVAHVDPQPDSLTGQQITLLYKVSPGICDQSFGIHVAELANFPAAVVKLAKRKADDLEDFTDVATDSTAIKIPRLSPEQIAEGTELVEQVLAAWVQAKKAAQGEDIEMDTGSAAAADINAEAKKQHDLLLSTYAQFKDKLDGSKWVQSVLKATY